MSAKVWMSSVKSNYVLGDKPGLRTKFYGYEWEPAEFVTPPAPDDVYTNMKRAGQGFALQREELPEAVAVWNEKRFKLLGEIFYTSGFLVVRGKLAEVLARFDLGDGGLVPVSFFKADLETPYPGEFFLLNFGCRKNTLVEEESKNLAIRGLQKQSGLKLMRVNMWSEDGDIALSTVALEGPDLWYEERIDNKFFLSERIVNKIVEIGLGETFLLQECRIVGNAA